MEARDWSVRDLVKALKKDHDGWGSTGATSAWLTGDLQPTMDRMERIATTLRIEPDYFAEYRLAKARRQLTPEEVGLAKALKHLERIENALSGV
jgi:transcriptional regulator with XRE-family HTH domain